MKIKNSVLETIEIIETANSSENVLNELLKFLERFGIEYAYLGHIVNRRRFKDDRVLQIANWPDELLNAQIEDGAAHHDPVIRYALQVRRPFFWKDAQQYATRYGLNFTNRAFEFGLKEGLMFPMINLEGAPGAVSVGGQQLDFDVELFPHVQLVVTQAYYRLERLLGPYPFKIEAHLTDTEADVIHYAARGKTSWEMSIILGMSEASVKAAIRRAREKLDAANVTHAVAEAMSRRLIV